MPKPGYSPEKDFIDIKQITGLSYADFDIQKSEYLNHIEEAQQQLKVILKSTYTFYSYDPITSQICRLPSLPLAYASCYITLDYFHNRITIPKKFYAALNKKNERIESLQKEYFLQRFAASFKNKSVSLILLYLIDKATPDQKKIDAFLKKPILNELSKASFLIKPKIEQLSINSINSEMWLIKQNQYDWIKLKSKLDKGKPWPVRLVNTNSDHPAKYYPFIAYNYIEQENSIVLQVQNTLNAELKLWEFPINKTVLDEQTGNLNGIIFDEYLSILPPLNFLNKVAYYTKIGFIFWWIAKSVSFFLNLNKTKKSS